MSDKKNKQKGPALDLSRRRFIKGAALAGVSITATGVVAKKAISLVPTAPADAAQTAYLKDIMRGDRVLRGEKLHLMSEGDKKELVRFFEESYRRQS